MNPRAEALTYTTPPQPRQVRLELTNVCNAKCASCHRAFMTRPVGSMSMALAEKCLADIQQFPEPLAELVPSNYGETFLHKGWFEILQLISRKLPQTPIVVPTNGTLLDGKLDLLLSIRTVKLINLSINAARPETYEAFMGLPASNLEKIERAVRRIRERRPDIILWASMVRDCRYQSPREEELFREKWTPLVHAVQVNVANYAKGREPLVPVTLPCRSLFSDLVVLYDGRVTSCCFDVDGEAGVLGDATKQSLLDCWHSREFAQLRKQHNDGRRAEVALCRSCTFA